VGSEITRPLEGDRYGTDGQGNGRGKTEEQAAQTDRRQRPLLSCDALRGEVLALALSLQGHGEDDVLRGISRGWLKEAREPHNEARKLWSGGIDPLAERKAEAEAKQNEERELQSQTESSFESIALA